jgi:hypothetical protein
MICPGKAIVFQICNENSDNDDNFDIVVNGTTIGQVDLNQNDQVGSVFIGGYYTLEEPDFVCPIENMVVYNFDDSILNIGSNTLDMNNTQVNFNNNYGTVQIRLYDIIDGGLYNPVVIEDLIYEGLDGENFSFTFDFECIGTTTPNPTSTPSTTSSTTSSTTCSPCYPQIPPKLKSPPLFIPTTIAGVNQVISLTPPASLNSLNLFITTTPPPTTSTTTTTTTTTTTNTTTIVCVDVCKTLKF